MTERADVLILGSGFGGSLLSLILARSGCAVVNVDKARHPRFAVGESSTPLADSVLAGLAAEFDLPELLPLAKYGTWKAAYPDITCGLKRGFSYFGHRAGRDFRSEDQMLVAASRSNDVSDTHWLRSDVDAFFFRRAGERGVRQFENADYSLEAAGNGWTVSGRSGETPFVVAADFVVDATGGSGQVLKVLNVASAADQLRTVSRAVFAHFQGVRTVGEVLTELNESPADHPFACDAAAVHHVLDTGWMWQLRFDDDTVSVGMVTADRKHSVGHSADFRQTILPRFDFLQRQFEDAVIVRPTSGLQSTPRLQRLTSQAAGQNWAVLPHTAGFIDPLHSTGIAHPLFGIRRLARILLSNDSRRAAALAEYSASVISELKLIDRLVEGCYAALPDFGLWCDWCMLYFAAVTSMEQSTNPLALAVMR